MSKKFVGMLTALSIGLTLSRIFTSPVNAGRLVLDQSPQILASHFGQPLEPQEDIVYTLNYPTDNIRRIFPDFPEAGELRVTYINNRAQRIELEPKGDFAYHPEKFFDYIFGYQPPIMQPINLDATEDPIKAELCLGNGIATEYKPQAPGDLFIIEFYYNAACEPPYGE
ncbi:MAG: hypothetical protein QNJ46_07585 [Leptolyngbyaceae cyanobacterium MO_188.B28]|nr:hypothetical protein [Leptolyngbyaceae cyanobacterium MO_188.B28]